MLFVYISYFLSPLLSWKLVWAHFHILPSDSHIVFIKYLLSWIRKNRFCIADSSENLEWSFCYSVSIIKYLCFNLRFDCQSLAIFFKYWIWISYYKIMLMLLLLRGFSTQGSEESKKMDLPPAIPTRYGSSLLIYFFNVLKYTQVSSGKSTKSSPVLLFS